ncbi:hypothetical protein B4N89_02425 [Embleya scabrispora]|uniref:Uncharacterized protein n=1 Tax=Embleya scabrispora TaxID=159449 RepID=A0A1T3NSS0_9ACTN|nr:hypothetical protein [Embleya scabrispora]OPC79953.1 hypothetical protein B4N89_02425 [Embleya scabrispora]
MTAPRRRPICAPTTPEDRAVVDQFRAYLRAARAAEARGTHICRAEPDTATGWPCTHDTGHDGAHTWETNR